MRVVPRHAKLNRHRRAISVGVFISLTAVIAACSDTGDGLLDPSAALTTGADSTRPRGDSTHRPPRDTVKPPPPDTLDSMPPLPQKVAVNGRVLGIVPITPTAGSRDTLRFDPIAGAKVRIMRNVLVNGAATQVLAAELVTDVNGRFSASLTGGYYVLYAEPPAGTDWSKSLSYLAASRPEVTVDLYLWKAR
ncbi:MAG TPA: hypothetical protein VJ717_21255 [Gemmatimonadaceae bacterium]|nr:hypothetical protein [Gemmatimonadaceae bacterium]